MNIFNNVVTDNSLAGPGHVPPKDLGLKRYPFVFLIDVSGSTGDEPDPDINHINGCLHDLLETLRNPIPSSELAKNTNKIDVSILAYSDSVIPVLPWSTVANLPPSVQRLNPLGGTATGKALKHAISLIGDRLTYYKSEAITYGMPHIIHLTDGAMNDMFPGEPFWNDVKSVIDNLDGTANSEKRRITLINFLSPKGTTAARTTHNGQTFTGDELLTQLSGKKSLFDMGREAATFDTLLVLITALVTNLTKNFGSLEALNKASETAKAATATPKG